VEQKSVLYTVGPTIACSHCSRLSRSIHLAFSSGTDNLWIWTIFSCFSFCTFKHVPRP